MAWREYIEYEVDPNGALRPSEVKDASIIFEEMTHSEKAWSEEVEMLATIFQCDGVDGLILEMVA